MKRILIAAMVGMWIGASGLSAADEPWLVYAAVKTGAAPVMDGRLNDPCWQGLERTRPLICLGGGAAPVATTGMACWDDQNLYLAVVCAEPLMPVILQKKAAGRLRPYDESVEIFIDAAHDHFTYLQFRVDIMGNRDTHERANLNRTLDMRWTDAVAQDRDQWTVEVAIPWNLLAKGRPDASTVWGLNLNRIRAAGPEVEYACWSDTQGGFHTPGRFGNLVFSPYPLFLQSYFSNAFRSAYAEMESMMPGSRTPVAQAETQLAAIKAENDQFLKSLESAAMASGQDAVAPYAHGQEQQRKLAVLQDELLLQAIKDLTSAPGTKP